MFRQVRAYIAYDSDGAGDARKIAESLQCTDGIVQDGGAVAPGNELVDDKAIKKRASAVGRALTNRSSPKRSDRAVAGGVLVEGDSIVWVLRSFARGFRRLLSSRSKGLLAVRPAEQLWFPTK